MVKNGIVFFNMHTLSFSHQLDPIINMWKFLFYFFPIFGDFWPLLNISIIFCINWNLKFQAKWLWISPCKKPPLFLNIQNLVLIHSFAILNKSNNLSWTISFFLVILRNRLVLWRFSKPKPKGYFILKFFKTLDSYVLWF